MEKFLSNALNTTSTDSLEIEVNDVVELIDGYPLPANFIHWLSKGEYSPNLIHEHTSAEKYTRIIQYRIQDRLIFTGKGVFYLDRLSKEFTHALLKHKEPIFSTHPSFRELEKKPISTVLAEPYYTIISHLCIKGTTGGMCWEVYELPPIIELYKQKKDPLRYWKMSRRG